MIVHSAYARDFGGLSEVTLAFPSAGVVAITGPNGAGKSSIFDAISAAVWGRTLRGTVLWGPASALAVSVSRDSAGRQTSVTRGSRGGKPTLPTWEGRERWDTITTANAGLAEMYGSWEVWRRVCYVDSYGSGAFTRATAGDRLAMLEAMIGLDALAGAATTARAALAEDERRLAAARVAIVSRREEIASLQRAAAAGSEAMADGTPEDDPAALSEALASLRARRSAIASRVEELRAQHRAREQARMAARERVRTAERDLERVEALRWCPTCEREVPPDHAAHLARAYTAQVQEEEERAREAAVAGSAIAESLGDAARNEQRVQEQIEEARAREARAQMAARDRARIAAIMESIDRDIAAARTALTTAETDSETYARSVAHIEEAVRVLGPNGLRAASVEEAVAHLDASVRSWLDRLGLRGEYRVVIASSRPRKSGGVTQAIDIRVDGHAGVSDIAGLSGGERRRVDLAVTAALAELAEAAVGWKGATMLYDEPFDALDVEGREAAARMLRELARDRLVLLVTHDDHLLRAVRPDVTYTMERGRIV